MRKGWFRIPGVQDGDRDPEEQLIGCDVALAEAAGRLVLDLGCAEGCMAAAFKRAGAGVVVGIDVVADHIAVARKQYGSLGIDFLREDMSRLVVIECAYDIVLALGSPHKLADPGVGVELAARAANRLVLLRTKPGAPPYVLRGKHSKKECRVDEVMARHGFTHTDTRPAKGNRYGEAVQYWRRA